MNPEPTDSAAAPQRRRISVSAIFDEFFFVFAGIAAVWLSWLVFTQSFQFGWFGILIFVVFWAILAYLVLPRLHRLLTTIYVPDGREQATAYLATRSILRCSVTKRSSTSRCAGPVGPRRIR